MPLRSVYYLDSNNSLHRYMTNVRWKWNQNKINVQNVQQNFMKVHPNNQPLEVSSSSPEKTGFWSSAKKMPIITRHGKFTIEHLYQASKFNNGQHVGKGQKPTEFNLFGKSYPTEPKTAFYDWLYLEGLHQRPSLQKALNKYNAFSDIYSNPQKVISTQARTCALYRAIVNIKGQQGFNEMMSKPDSFQQLSKLDRQLSSTLEPVPKSQYRYSRNHSQSKHWSRWDALRKSQNQGNAQSNQPARHYNNNYRSHQKYEKHYGNGNSWKDIKVPYTYDKNYSKLDNRLMHANKAAVVFYEHALHTRIGKDALGYLHGRKLNDDTIKQYHIGYAPQRTYLVSFLRSHGFSDNIISQTGLANKNKYGKVRNAFFDRVMVPITDRHGHVIAFSGRALNEQEKKFGKYRNTEETPLFQKGKTIFNLDKAIPSIKKNDRVYLMEGYMDVISAHQAGVNNVVASMGTSLTHTQMKKLSQLTKNITVCYDGDQPGQDAIADALRHLKGGYKAYNFKMGKRYIMPKTGINRSAVQMPEGIDPDEYRRKYGSKAFAKYMHDKIESPQTFAINHLHDRCLDTKNMANKKLTPDDFEPKAFRAVYNWTNKGQDIKSLSKYLVQIGTLEKAEGDSKHKIIDRFEKFRTHEDKIHSPEYKQQQKVQKEQAYKKRRYEANYVTQQAVKNVVDRDKQALDNIAWNKSTHKWHDYLNKQMNKRKLVRASDYASWPKDFKGISDDKYHTLKDKLYAQYQKLHYYDKYKKYAFSLPRDKKLALIHKDDNEPISGTKNMDSSDLNIFKSSAQVIVNPVNTIGVMGKGLAKEYKQVFPKMYKEYRQKCKNGQLKVGQPWLYKNDDKWVLNLPTKQSWKGLSKPDYIEAGLQNFAQNYKKWGIKSISFPKLGAGLGKLDYDKQVALLMKKYLSKLPIKVYIHDGGKYMAPGKVKSYLIAHNPKHLKNYLNYMKRLEQKKALKPQETQAKVAHAQLHTDAVKPKAQSAQPKQEPTEPAEKSLSIDAKRTFNDNVKNILKKHYVDAIDKVSNKFLKNYSKPVKFDVEAKYEQKFPFSKYCQQYLSNPKIKYLIVKSAVSNTTKSISDKNQQAVTANQLHDYANGIRASKFASAVKVQQEHKLQKATIKSKATSRQSELHTPKPNKPQALKPQANQPKSTKSVQKPQRVSEQPVTPPVYMSADDSIDKLETMNNQHVNDVLEENGIHDRQEAIGTMKKFISLSSKDPAHEDKDLINTIRHRLQNVQSMNVKYISEDANGVLHKLGQSQIASIEKSVKPYVQAHQNDGMSPKQRAVFKQINSKQNTDGIYNTIQNNGKARQNAGSQSKQHDSSMSKSITKANHKALQKQQKQQKEVNPKRDDPDWA